MATLCPSMTRVLPGFVIGVTSSSLLCSSLIGLVISVKKNMHYVYSAYSCRR